MGTAQREWKRLRRKVGTDADQDWANIQAHPATVIATVAGTASDGDYVFTVNPVDAGVASIANTFTRGSGENNTTIADEIRQLLAADIVEGGDLFAYIESVSDSAGAITFQPKQGAPPFTVDLTAPGTGTFVASPIDTYPISRGQSFHRASLSAMTMLEIAFIPVDSSDNPLTDNNAMTLTVEILDVVPRAGRHLSAGVSTSKDLAVGVTSSTAVAGHSVTDKLTVAMNGSAAMGVRLSALTNTPSNYSALEVWVREAVA